jgi:hypothetical protein
MAMTAAVLFTEYTNLNGQNATAAASLFMEK